MAARLKLINRLGQLLSISLVDTYGVPQSVDLQPYETIIIRGDQVTPYIRRLSEGGHVRLEYYDWQGVRVVYPDVAGTTIVPYAPQVTVT
jgi:hypothetical protein